MAKVQPKNPLTLYERENVAAGHLPLMPEQIMHILQKTPRDHIYTRPAKGGGTWDYVTGAYVQKVLNYVFGWDWDFEIKEKIEKENQVVVLGKLTVRTINGKTIVKEQFGRADVKKNRTTGGYLDFGNDLKAAATDALKKCASELGIASDVYGKEEFRQIEMVKVEETPIDTTPITEAQKQTILNLLPAGDIIDEEVLNNMTIIQAGEKIKELATAKK